MIGYATLTDLRARFVERELIQLTDDEGRDALDEARVTRALQEASNIVDGYVGAKYARADEATPVPPVLVDLTCDIAFFRLHKRKGTVPEHIGDANKAALARLREIATGVFKLDQGVETIPERDGVVLVSVQDRLFGRERLNGF